MIKLAGAKNDGAWFRTNKFLKKFKANDENGVQVITDILLGVDGFDDYVDAVNNICTYYGVQLNGPFIKDDFAANWTANGIPREVWLGVPRMTVYEKIAIPGTSDPVKYRWHDLYASAFRTFAINLRYQLRNWIKAQAFVADVESVTTAQQGNPGGLPNATKGD